MGSLPDSSSTSSSLAWLWIIEYFASLEQVDTSILYDLIEEVPELPEDLAKKAWELVALRCLEDLSGSSKQLANEDLSATEKKVGFISSENCVDALQRVVQETPKSDLEMAGPELCKWDIHSFTMRKRASMPKCALQRLKDTILEGTHPLAASFKETSGLMSVNEHGRTCIDDINHDALTSMLDGSDTDAETMAVTGNLIPSTCENGNRLSGDHLPNKKLLPSKRDRNDLFTEDMAGSCSKTQGEPDDHFNLKKLKQDATCTDQSIKQFSVPLHGMLEDFSGRVVGVTEGKNSELANLSQDDVMEESHFVEDGHGELVESKRFGQNGAVNDGKIQHNQTVVDQNTGYMSEDTSGDQPVKNVLLDEVNVTEPRTSICTPSIQEIDSVNTEGKGSELANQSQDDVMEEGQFPEDAHGKLVDSKRLEQNGDVNDSKIQHNQVVVGQNTDKVPGDLSADGPVQNVILDEVNVTEPRTSTGAPSTRRIDSVSTEGGGCDLVNQSQDDVMDENQFREDGHDKLVDSKRHGQNSAVNDRKIQHNQVMDGHNTDKMPKDTSGEEPLQNVIVGEVNVTKRRTSNGAPSTQPIDCVDTEGEGCDFANQSQDEVMDESQSPEGGHAKLVDSKRLGQDGVVNDDKIQHNQILVGHNADKRPEDTSGDESLRNGILDEANVTELRLSAGAPSMGTQRQDSINESKDGEEKVSSDNDEYHKEKANVAMKKNHFLLSQCSLGYDSLATTGRTKQNLCMKCNKDGQLLVCTTSSCPLVFHENCLGSAVKFDENGNFYCPFCAYSLAISKYLEGKKSASLAHKDVAAFFQTGSEHHPKESDVRLHRKGKSHSRKKGDEEIHENGHLGEREHNQVNQNDQCVHNVEDHRCQKSVGNRQQRKPSASRVNANLPFREEVVNVISGTACVSCGKKAGEENMVKECPSVEQLEEQQDQAPASPKCDGDNLPHVNNDIAPVDQSEGEGGVGIQEEDLQHASTDPPDKPIFVLNIDGEETSQGDQDKHIISSYSIRQRKQERHYTYPCPASLKLRRIKVPWTAEEEEILKKGVKKFGRVEDGKMSWKKILEFGSSVFLRDRTTIDLKDKWRNMCKGSQSPNK